jgi:hypothetical protein
MNSPARAQLLAALADVGVEPDDYALIEQAKALVDDVNARLRARGSAMVYSVTFCAARPRRPESDATTHAGVQTSAGRATRTPLSQRYGSEVESAPRQGQGDDLWQASASI